MENIFSTLPISADGPPDGRAERLPKTMSRRLLPAESDRRSRRLLRDAMDDFMEDVSSPGIENRPSLEKRSSTASSRSRYIPDPDEKAIQDPDRSSRRSSVYIPTSPVSPASRPLSSRRDRSPQSRRYSTSVPEMSSIGSGVAGHGPISSSPLSTSALCGAGPTQGKGKTVGITPVVAERPPPRRESRDARDDKGGQRNPSVRDKGPRPGTSSTASSPPSSVVPSSRDMVDDEERKASRGDGGAKGDDRGPTWGEYLKRKTSISDRLKRV